MLINLKSVRKETGLTQKQVADAIHVSQQTYSDYENCKTEPTSETLIEIARFFGVTVDELLDREEFSLKESEAGFSDKRKVSITPIEDDMLYEFRQVGKKRGEEAQRALITIAKSMQ